MNQEGNESDQEHTSPTINFIIDDAMYNGRNLKDDFRLIRRNIFRFRALVKAQRNYLNDCEETFKHLTSEDTNKSS